MNNRENVKNSNVDWAFGIELEQTSRQALIDTEDACLVPALDAPELHGRSVSRNVMADTLRAALRDKPKDQTLLYGYVLLGEPVGNHFASYVIDTKTQTVVVFEPFGHRGAYNTKAIEAGIKDVFPTYNVLKNQTQFQHDTMNCGGISRDAATFLVAQCANQPNNKTRLADARQALDNDGELHKKWYEAWNKTEPSQTAIDTKTLGIARGQLSQAINKQVGEIIRQFDAETKRVLLNKATQGRHPDYAYAEFSQELTRCIRHEVLRHPLSYKRFLSLNEAGQKKLVLELAKVLTDKPLRRGANGEYSIVLDRNDLRRCHGLTENAFAAARQRPRQRPDAPAMPEQRPVAQGPHRPQPVQPQQPHSTHQRVQTELHADQRQHAVPEQAPVAPAANTHQPPKPKPAPQPVRDDVARRPIVERSTSEPGLYQSSPHRPRMNYDLWTIRDAQRQNIRIKEGPFEISIRTGKTSSISLHQNQQRVGTVDITFIATHATVVQDRQRGQVNLLIVGLDNRARLVDFRQPEPVSDPIGPKLGSYATCSGSIEKDGQTWTAISSAQSIHLWDPINDPEANQSRTISIEGTRVISSFVGLGDGWIACTDRLGSLYLVDPQENAYKLNDEDVSVKRHRQDKLTGLSIQDGKLMQHSKDSQHTKPLEYDIKQLTSPGRDPRFLPVPKPQPKPRKEEEETYVPPANSYRR